MDKIKVYTPIENLYYSLSIILNRKKQINEKAFLSRLYSFAELIESLILFDDIYTDYGEDKIDIQINDVLKEYELTNIIPAIKIEASAKDFSPHLLKNFSLSDLEYIFKLPIDLIKSSKTLRIEITKKLTDNLILDVAKSNSDNMIDFFYIVLPALYGANAFNNYFEYFSTWDAVSNAIEENKLIGKLKDELVSKFSIFFQGFTESALSVSLLGELSFLPFQLQSKLISCYPTFAPSSRIFINKLTKHKYQNLAKLNDFIYYNFSKIIHLPLLFNYVLSKANSIKDIFKIAIDLRYKREVEKFRKFCSQIDEALKLGLQEEASEMISITKSYIKDLSRITNNPLRIQVQVSFPPAIIFNVSSSKIKRKNHLVFLKEIFYNSKSPIIVQEKVNKIFRTEI